MPSLKLTKPAIDALPTPERDTVDWDADNPGFGLQITPRGRKLFLVLHRLGGAGVTLANARAEAQQVLAARANGRNPASEKSEKKERPAGVVDAC